MRLIGSVFIVGAALFCGVEPSAVSQHVGPDVPIIIDAPGTRVAAALAREACDARQKHRFLAGKPSRTLGGVRGIIG